MKRSVVSDLFTVPPDNRMQIEFTIAPLGIKRTPSKSSPFVIPEAAKTSSLPLCSIPGEPTPVGFRFRLQARADLYFFPAVAGIIIAIIAVEPLLFPLLGRK